MSKRSGSCLCGEVTFELDGDFDHFYLCHCSLCRKDSGSAHGANLFSSSATLTWLSGEEKITHFTLPGTRHHKSFCSLCGSALPNMQMDGKLLVVPAGSLDCDFDMRPTAHIFVASKAHWDKDLDDIPQIDTFPS